MKCLLCSNTFTKELSWLDLVAFRKIEKESLCPNCSQQFIKCDKLNCCPTCYKPNALSNCSDCLAWKKRSTHNKPNHMAIYQYNTAMHDWFQEYKFQGNYRLAACFTTEIRKALKNFKNFLVVPIPLTENRLTQRGFNQVEGLLVSANILFEPLLYKEKQFRSQSKKNRVERLAMKQPFTIKAESFQRIAGKNVLLVDDIYTTGQTLYRAFECVLSAKPLVVQTFSLAR